MPRNALAAVCLVTAMNLVANSLKAWTEGNHAAWLILFALAGLLTALGVSSIRSSR